MKRTLLTITSGSGLILVFLFLLVVQTGTHVPASAAGATPNPALAIPTPAPRGPTVAPATAGPDGTAIPPGGYRTLPNGLPVSVSQAGPTSPISGLPAITPRTLTSDPLTPAFTTQDAIAYVTTHDVGMKVYSSGPVAVATVQFLPGKSAGTMLGRSLPLEDNRLLCVVKLSGTFTIVGPPGGGNASRKSAYEIFDAHTGNSLMTIA